MVYDGYISTRGAEITKGTEMTTQTTPQRQGKCTVHSSFASIIEHIGAGTIFHGSCIINQPVLSICDMSPTRTIGREEKTYSGRFQIIINIMNNKPELRWAAPRKRIFSTICVQDQVQWCSYMVSALVSKAGA